VRKGLSIIVGIAILLFAYSASAGVVTSNLVSWWKFDETSGTTAYDTEGSATNNGTLNNYGANGTWTTDTAGSASSGALYFNASSNNYVNCGTDASLTGLTSWTTEAWVKINEGGGTEQVLVGFNANDNNSHNIIRGYGEELVSQLILGNNYHKRWYHSPVDVDDGNWHHIVFVVDSTDIAACKLYADGQEQTYHSREISGGSALAKERFIIGSTAEIGWRHLNGIIDQVHIYGRALSVEEIEALYEDER